MKAYVYTLLSLLVPAVYAQDVAPVAAGVSTSVIASPSVEVSGAQGEAPSAFQLLDAERAKNMDADELYVSRTMALNQAAMDAAKAVLKTSFDADIRMMAGDSLKIHDAELRTLQNWMALHGPKETVAEVSSSPTTMPVVPRKVEAKVETPLKPKAEAKVTTKAEPVPAALAPVKAFVSATEPAVVPVVAGDVSASFVPMPTPEQAIPHEAPKMDMLDKPVGAVSASS